MATLGQVTTYRVSEAEAQQINDMLGRDRSYEGHSVRANCDLAAIVVHVGSGDSALQVFLPGNRTIFRNVTG
jgi:hypothetical protein